MSTSPTLRLARRRLAAARAHRTVLEQARFEGITSTDSPRDSRALRAEWAAAVVRETIAEQQFASVSERAA